MGIELGGLLSRAKRLALTPDGIKTISSAIQTANKDTQGGILGWLWDAGKKLLGFALKAIWAVLKAFQWSLTKLWGLITGAFQAIWNFDWNQADSKLDETISNGYKALLVQLGGTLGAIAGWLVCGVVPGVVLFVFNEPLGIHVLNEVGKEAVEELAGTITGLLQSTAKQLGRHFTLGSYKRVRRLIIGREFTDGLPTQSADQIRDRLSKEHEADLLNGTMTQDQLNKKIESTQRVAEAAKQGTEAKPWTFQKKFEEWRETNIPKWLQDAAEEFAEEFSDSCIEAGYVVAGSIDSYIAATKITAPNIIGSPQTVVIDFDRDDTATPSPSPSPSPTPSPSPSGGASASGTF